MQKLAENFLCVADEVWCLDNLDVPAGRFFKEYWKKVPPEKWTVETTKQGVYCMTAEGDYLGAHFARHSQEDTLAMLKEALAKWEEVRTRKGLTPKPVPRKSGFWGAEGVTPRAGGVLGKNAALVLQVHSRDLPRGESDPGMGGYSKAWNMTWLEFTAEEAAGLVPSGAAKAPVPPALARRLMREALIDNVRGQTDVWPDEAVRKAVLTSEGVASEKDSTTVRFVGEFAADGGGRSFDGKLYGKAVYDVRRRRFTSFELVAAGVRRGETGVTFRAGEGSSPLGICLTLDP